MKKVPELKKILRKLKKEELIEMCYNSIKLLIKYVIKYDLLKKKFVEK